MKNHCLLHRTCQVACVLLLTIVSSLSNWFGTVAYGGEFVSHNISSPAIAKNIMGISSLRHVKVYLPDGYEKGGWHYPTLYWITGWKALMAEDYRTLNDAIKTGKIPPAIAVFIDMSDGIAFLNSPEFGDWEDFLLAELIPFIDKNYRTIPDWRKRALMGVSIGGYSALILPLLHPNTWGAVGLNDPSVWVGYDELYIGKEGEVPEPIRGDVAFTQDVWKHMPANLEGYKTADDSQQINMQLGVAISPNPAAPLHFDVPVDKDGKVIPAVIEKWRAYCLMDPTTIAKHRATLSDLSMIAVIVPEVNGGLSNRYQNLLMMEQMEAVGIPVTRLDWPGAHGDFRGERFVALAGQVLTAMESATPVSPKGKVATLWGKIKRGQ
ncbi:hypothetical protein HYR99_06430 [Candidatus Poribacteria bacterium]|nr:hypothetical protein [Candidatus Poribacteria bacterium]